jgi:hypothetical protein
MIEILAHRSHKAWQSKPLTCISMMGSQPSSNFLAIEAFCFNFSSLIFMRALIICLVKAIFIGLALGVKASFCKNKITSDILQPTTSKSLKEIELSSHILQKISAHF